MCNQRILRCRFCQKNVFEYRVSQCTQYAERCNDLIAMSPDLTKVETICPVRPELWFTSTTCGNRTCQPGSENYLPSRQYAGLKTQYTPTMSLREPLDLSVKVPSDSMMSVEDEWRIVRPVQRGKTEVIFCRDNSGYSLPPKTESPMDISESAHTDAQEPRIDPTWLHQPYLLWLRAFAPDRDSGLSCPPAGDCLPYVGGRVRSHSLQEGNPGKLEESWNLLTRIKNWVFSDYDPPTENGGSTTKADVTYGDNASPQEKMAGTFPPDIPEFPSFEFEEYDLFFPSPKSSSRLIPNTRSPLFRDLEAALSSPSFFDYSSDGELDASFHTAHGESSDLTNDAISSERLSDQETHFGDNGAEELEPRPQSPMEKGLPECSVHDFSGNPAELPGGRESLLGGGGEKPKRSSPNEPRANKPYSRSILERDWGLDFSLGTSLFYDLVEEQGAAGHVVGGSTCTIGNNKGGQEK